MVRKRRMRQARWEWLGWLLLTGLLVAVVLGPVQYYLPEVVTVCGYPLAVDTASQVVAVTLAAVVALTIISRRRSR